MNFELIIAILGLLFGTGGVFYAVMYWRENKQLKANEVKDLQYKSETTFIENMDKAVDVYKEALEFQKEQTKEVESFHVSKFERLAESLKIYKEQVELFQKDSTSNRQQLHQLSQKVKILEKKINDDKHLICHNLLCQIRQPEKK